ncbi:uncharacterized protein LOC111404947 [Olea europaea var. sylvestris]|uniref:uncharacterized protein LOC111404947 n=1 Tax=Olea europaea var. sylvestris TaxID=158386 RepID=UPI000C1D04F8|nr:uncharacterized protein LOC111404947 [Olea europaea var. sylvestris]
MCWVYVCGEEERELGRQQVGGSCPHCKAKVDMVDFECKRKFCFLPVCLLVKRRYICTHCSRHLVLYS